MGEEERNESQLSAVEVEEVAAVESIITMPIARPNEESPKLKITEQPNPMGSDPMTL